MTPSQADMPMGNFVHRLVLDKTPQSVIHVSDNFSTSLSFL